MGQVPVKFLQLYPQPVWYDSNRTFITTDEGTVDLIDESGNLIQTFQSEDKNEKYWDSTGIFHSVRIERKYF